MRCPTEMTPKLGHDAKKNEKREYRNLATRLKEIDSKVDHISRRLDDHRHLLQEILENNGRDNGHDMDWYDPYEAIGYE